MVEAADIAAKLAHRNRTESVTGALRTSLVDSVSFQPAGTFRGVGL
jgi:hypothetical protein